MLKSTVNTRKKVANMAYKARPENPVIPVNMGNYKNQSVKAALVRAATDRGTTSAALIKASIIPWLVEHNYLNDGGGAK